MQYRTKQYCDGPRNVIWSIVLFRRSNLSMTSSVAFLFVLRALRRRGWNQRRSEYRGWCKSNRKKVMSYPPRPSGWSFVTTRKSQSSPPSPSSGFLLRRGENECGQHGLWLVVKETKRKGCLSKKERGSVRQKMSVRNERMKRVAADKRPKMKKTRKSKGEKGRKQTSVS